MNDRNTLTATILRVIQRTADVQGNVTMIRLATAIATEIGEDNLRGEMSERESSCPACGHAHPDCVCNCGCEYDSAFCGRCGWLDCECGATTTPPAQATGEATA